MVIIYYIGFIVLFALALIYVSVNNKKRGRIRHSSGYDENYMYDIDIFSVYGEKNGEDDDIIEIPSNITEVSSSMVDDTEVSAADNYIRTLPDNDISNYLYSISDINTDKFTDIETSIITSKINDSLDTKNSDILIIIDTKTNSVDDIMFNSFSKPKMDVVISNILEFITNEKNRYTIIYIGTFGVVKGFLKEAIKLNRIVQ